MFTLSYKYTYLINAHCYTEVLLYSMSDKTLSIHHQLNGQKFDNKVTHTHIDSMLTYIV